MQIQSGPEGGGGRESTYYDRDDQHDVLGIRPPNFARCEGSMVHHAEDKVGQAGKLEKLGTLV